MAQRIQRTLCKYEIAPVTAIPAMTRPGYAMQDIPAMQYSLLNGTESRTRFDDFLDGGLGGGAETHCDLSEILNGIILAPPTNSTYYSPLDLQGNLIQMDLSQWTGSTGEAILTKPFGYAMNHVCTTNNAANHATAFTSTFMLPPEPTIILNMTRYALPPDGMNPNDQKWTLTFGGGYTLVIQREVSAKLYAPPVGSNPPVQIAQRPLGEVKNSAYSTDCQLQFVIYNFMGNLYIFSKAFGGCWTVKLTEPQTAGALAGRRIATYLPAATVGFASTGGVTAFHICAATYATSGNIITDWTPIYMGDVTYPSPVYDATNHPEGVEFTAWPMPANAAVTPTGWTSPLYGQSVQMQVYAVQDAGASPTGIPRKQYQVTLTGDGYHTPLVQVWQPMWRPLFADATGSWIDISPWVELKSVTETKTVQMSPNTLALTIIPNDDLWGLLTDAGMENLTDMQDLEGNYAFRYSFGYRYLNDDQTTTDDIVTRMTGYLDGLVRDNQVGAIHRLQLTVKDQWEILGKGALEYPPCIAGKPADEGIALIVSWKGIAPANINMQGTFTTPLDKPEPDGDYSGTPPWLPGINQHAAEFIRTVCDTYLGYCYFDGDGIFQIKNRVNGLPDAYSYIYSAYKGSDGSVIVPEAQSITADPFTEDRSGMVNAIQTRGLGIDGRPVVAYLADNDSINTPNSPRYLGYVALEIQDRQDLRSQERTTLACKNSFNWRNGGFRKVCLHTQTADFWRLWPNNWFQFIDAANNTYTLYLIELTTKPDNIHLVCEMTGEERGFA